MNTLTTPKGLARVNRKLAIASALCMAVIFPVNAFAGDTDPRANASEPAETSLQPAPEYRFFAGVDPRLEYNGTFLPMVGFLGDSVVLWSDGKPLKVPLQDIQDIKFFQGYRLSRNLVELSEPEVSKIVSKPDGDNYSKNMMKMMLLQSMADDARDASLHGLRFGSQTTAEADMTQSHLDTVSGANHGNNKDAGTPDGDTINIHFTVASQYPVTDAYALVLLFVKDKDTGKIQQWIHFAQLGDIDSEPKHVNTVQTGRPDNVDLLEARVFVYSHGEEVATSFSAGLKDASADEARELANRDYIELNKDRTIPASLATNSISDELAERLNELGVSRNVVLQLDENARITAAECDGAPVTGEALTLLQQLVFHPGLKDGKPKASSVRMNIDQFSESNLLKLAEVK